MKTLGLDLGTNSIGWGIVDESAPENRIKKCGVYIFPEGVKIEKGIESSKAAERTKFRLARRLKFRRKLRKYETLKVLIANDMCPLSKNELESWRKNKIYPTNPAFIEWYRTDEKNKWEPYFLRKKCVEEKATKLEIGRAMYHLAQRRGFLSNRKEITKNDNGKVNTQIDEITKAKGDKTLGQYFYELKQNNEKVRTKYTSRKIHYEEEFNKICEVQNIPDSLKKDLYKAIFFQRKLKSQKFLIGKCTFEPNKRRCSVSHFEFEEFRMWSFINNIKIAKNIDENDKQDLVFLSNKEKESIIPLFFRKSKSTFKFEDISKKLKGKNEYWCFNYKDYVSVSGRPVSTGLKNIFGEDWKTTKIDSYNITDIWHVLFDFDDDNKLKEFAVDKLHLNEEQTKEFLGISIRRGYANLSLKAIRNILPFLREGYLYPHAAFLANIPTMIGKDIFEKNKTKILTGIKEIFDTIKEKNNIIYLTNACIEKIFKDPNRNFQNEEWDHSIVDLEIKDLYGSKKWNEKLLTEQKKIIKEEIIHKIDDTLKNAISKNYNNYKYHTLRTDDLIVQFLKKSGFSIRKGKKIYHPSDNDYNFKSPTVIDDKKYLASPQSASVKNPVVMRALYQLRKLINYLIKTDEIDPNTRIHIELAKEVNDKNWRRAIEEFQRNNEKKNEEYRNKIMEMAKENNFEIVPTDSDIKKYRLWIEQNKECPYTGKKINFCQLFSENPQFDFEHTIPRSLSYDDSLENLTLCNSEFNRNIKKQQLPSQLADFDIIAKRFNRYYEEKIDRCYKIIEQNTLRGIYKDPETKDKMIVKRHVAKLEKDYYSEKLKRFMAKEVTGGFKNSQLNDTRIITKFALSYLKSVFTYVQPVKGSFTDLFKRQWGLLTQDEKKDRSFYTHHAIDAIVIACVNRGKFNLLSETIKKSSAGTKLKIAKPWDTFDKDTTNAVTNIIPKFYIDDNSLRQTKKILRDKHGKPILKNGEKKYIQGNTARGSLHKDTFYGRIMTPPEKDKQKEEIYVQRIPCDKLSKENANKIIDKAIRETFFNNIETKKQTLEDIWTNGILLPYKINGKDIFVKKVRIKAKPTLPLCIKKHHDISNKKPKEYKQYYYAVNDENYLIAIYRGINSNKKEVSCFNVLNLMKAVYRKQNKKPLYETTYKKQNIILSLYKTIKIGQTVILQETVDEDVFKLSYEKLWNRIYRVNGLETDGRIKLIHCIIAETFSTKESTNGKEYSKFIRKSANQLYCLIENKDFIITPTGEIQKLQL